MMVDVSRSALRHDLQVAVSEPHNPGGHVSVKETKAIVIEFLRCPQRAMTWLENSKLPTKIESRLEMVTLD